MLYDPNNSSGHSVKLLLVGSILEHPLLLVMFPHASFPEEFRSEQIVGLVQDLLQVVFRRVDQLLHRLSQTVHDYFRLVVHVVIEF